MCKAVAQVETAGLRDAQHTLILIGADPLSIGGIDGDEGVVAVYEQQIVLKIQLRNGRLLLEAVLPDHLSGFGVADTGISVGVAGCELRSVGRQSHVIDRRVPIKRLRIAHNTAVAVEIELAGESGFRFCDIRPFRIPAGKGVQGIFQRLAVVSLPEGAV